MSPQKLLTAKSAKKSRKCARKPLYHGGTEDLRKNRIDRRAGDPDTKSPVAHMQRSVVEMPSVVSGDVNGMGSFDSFG